MKYRILGRTGLSVSTLALGTVELGLEYGIAAPGHAAMPSIGEGIRLVHSALDAGINFVDTARAYGDSERVLGEALKGRRDKVILATKGAIHQRTDGGMGTSFAGQALIDAAWESLHTSLDLLQTDRIDIWMVHNVDHSVLAQKEALTELFEQMRASGKVGWIGGTFYGVNTPLAALDSDLFDVYQVTYSVLDQRVADQFLDVAQEMNVGVVARSVLLQGVLTERGEHLPPHLAALMQKSRQFRKLVLDGGGSLTAPQAAVAFALANPQIQAALIGVSSETELAENLQALDHSLSEELLQALQVLRVDDEDLLNPGKW